MFETVCESDRGQVGIGTLIVFIAMVLVAAIAAGVLINTAGFLQSKSEKTGQQSGRQVTNRLQVVAAAGGHIDLTGGNTIGVVNLTVKKAPGSGNVDLENVTVQWIGPSGTHNLVEQSVTATGANGKFLVKPFKDADGSVPVLNEPDDRMVLVFDVGGENLYQLNGVPNDNENDGAGPGDTDSDSGTLEENPTATDPNELIEVFGREVEEGAQISLQITTKSGATTTSRLVIPQSLSGKSAVIL